MAHSKVTKSYSNNTGTANTFSYSGNFDVFKGEEVIALLDNVKLTFTSSTINESASPREYTVDTTAKTIHIGGADLSSGTIIMRPETDMGDPTAQATFSAGSSVTAADLNNNQLQLLRKAMEYDDQKLSSTGGTMTGDLTMGEDTKIVFEGATDDAYETTLTVADPSGSDKTITLPNVTGTVVTTGDTATVTATMLGANSVDSSELVDGSIDASHISSGAVTEVKLDSSAVTTAKIADSAVNSDKIADGAIVNADINASAAIAHSKLANVTDGQILVGNGSNVPTAVAVSGDVTIANTGAVTIASDAVEIGMIGCEQTTISDSDSHIPTSGAVVDYVTSRIAPIGGLEVIDDDESFEEVADMPPAGVVVSITDAAGLQVNSSGVSTNADTKTTNATVTINGFPSELRGGVGGNADPYVFGSGAGLMVVSTGSSNTYNYHQAMIREADFVQLSDDINDFNNRYRIGTKTADSDSSNDDGDLFFDTGANKMYVYDGAYGSGGTWKEVTSAGDFKILTIKDHDQAVGGSGPTYGSNVEFDLFDGSADASINSAQQLIVVLNGVVQKPNASYDGSMEGFSLNDTHGIKFATAPPSGSTMFVTQFGTATAIGTPGDNTVTSAKIVDGAILNADINASANIAGSKIADDTISEAKLDIHAAPSGTDKFLGYTSNGMEWTSAADTTKMPLAGGSFTGDVIFDNATNTGKDITWDESDDALEFADDTKVTFGAGNDLIIHSDGTDSYITSNGAGSSLNIRQNGTATSPQDQVTIQAWDTNASAYKTVLTTGASTEPNIVLLHDGTQKAQTIATGLGPASDSTDDLGTSAVRWRNVYADTVYGDGSNLTGISSAQFGRNLLINGGMDIHQRGNRYHGTQVTIENGYTFPNEDDSYTLDRWNLVSDGNDIVDVTQETTEVPTAALNSIRLDVETTNKKFGLVQIIEKQKCFHAIGGKVSLSFQMKASAVDKLDSVKAAVISWSSTADAVTSDVVSAWQAEGTRPTLATNWTYENANDSGTTGNFTPTTSWATYTLKDVNVDTSSTNNIAVFIWSDVTDTTAGQFLYITNVQLEKGSDTTDFDYKPLEYTMHECKRYFQMIARGGNGGTTSQDNQFFGVGLMWSTNYSRAFLEFDAEMRVMPTFVATAPTNGYTFGKTSNPDIQQATTLNIDHLTRKRAELYTNINDITGTAGHIGYWRTNSSDAILSFNAEL